MEIRILEAIDRPSSDAKRLGKMDVNIRYQVDGAKIYAIDVPKESVTPAELQKRITAVEAERSKIVGMAFKV